jgi:8-oxo-dGTP pyrophosphatase MutT (NUDIX family)
MNNECNISLHLIDMLLQVANFHGFHVSNAVTYIITASGHIVLGTRKNGTFGFPGGKIEKFDRTPFKAAKRETLEELGWHKFPFCHKIVSFVWNNHTAIFLCFTNEKLPYFKINHEMIAMNLVTIEDLKHSLNGHTLWKLRDSEINSTKAIINLLF